MLEPRSPEALDYDAAARHAGSGGPALNSQPALYAALRLLVSLIFPPSSPSPVRS